MSKVRFRDVEIRAARGSEITAKSWLTEAALRMGRIRWYWSSCS